MYLRHGRSQVPYYQPKKWGATCTCHRYLFSHTKYEPGHVPEAWPVAGTLLPTQNMRRNVYLPPVPVLPPKIWSRACSWGLAGRKYLLSYLKCEAGHVPEARSVGGTCFPTQNVRRNVFLRPGQLYAGGILAFPLVNIVTRGQQQVCQQVCQQQGLLYLIDR